MNDRIGELAEPHVAGPLCDLGLLAQAAVDAHRISPGGYVRHVDADLPGHPLLVRGYGEDVFSLVAASIACVARWPGVNRRIVVGARPSFERVELFVGHGNSIGSYTTLPMSLDDLERADGIAPFEAMRGRMMRLLDTLNATLVLGCNTALDALALSIAFPGVSGRSTHRPFPSLARKDQANR